MHTYYVLLCSNEWVGMLICDDQLFHNFQKIMKLIEFGKKGKMNVVVGSVGVSRTPFFKWPLP